MTAGDEDEDDVPEFLRRGWKVHEEERERLKSKERPTFLHDPDRVPASLDTTTRIERETMMRPSYDNLNGQQLLDTYNVLVGKDRARKSKFSSKAEGVAACEAAWAEKNGKADKTPTSKTKGTTVVTAREGTKTSRRLAMRIELTRTTNPRREGTDAHKHWEAMAGRPTVAEYLNKFEPDARRTAAQWLSNTVRDGHARVVNPA